MELGLHDRLCIHFDIRSPLKTGLMADEISPESLKMDCVCLKSASVPEYFFTVWTSASKSVAQQPAIAGSLVQLVSGELRWFSPGGTLKWTLGKIKCTMAPFWATQIQRAQVRGRN